MLGVTLTSCKGSTQTTPLLCTTNTAGSCSAALTCLTLPEVTLRARQAGRQAQRMRLAPKAIHPHRCSTLIRPQCIDTCVAECGHAGVWNSVCAASACTPQPYLGAVYSPPPNRVAASPGHTSASAWMGSTQCSAGGRERAQRAQPGQYSTRHSSQVTQKTPRAGHGAHALTGRA